MDKGSVVHELVLGKGGGIAAIDHSDWRTKTAQEFRKAKMLEGKIPILEKDLLECDMVAEKIREQMRIIDSNAFVLGDTEVVGVWHDRIGDTVCRMMADHIANGSIIYDLKTTNSGLSDRQLQTKIADGYDVQAAFYIRGLTHIYPHTVGMPLFRWVFAEVKPPYSLRVIEADNTTIAMGMRNVEYALNVWSQCLHANIWPSYPAKIEKLEYPPWSENAWLAREMREEEKADDILYAG